MEQLYESKYSQKAVKSLVEIFTKFDEKVEFYQLERIKTIGDSYMVAAGVPAIKEDHASRICRFALDLKNEMIKVLEEHNKLFVERAKIISKERGQRIGKAQKVAEGLTGEERAKAFMGQLKGKHTQPGQQADWIRENLGQENINKIFDMVEEAYDIVGFDYAVAYRALGKIFRTGEIIVPSERAVLETIYGPEVTSQLIQASKSWINIIPEIVNIPRAIMASMDLSFGFRQGIFVASRHPKIFFNNWLKLKIYTSYT